MNHSDQALGMSVTWNPSRGFPDRACLHKRPSYCLSKSSGHAIPTGNTKPRSLYLVTVLMLCPW